MAVLGITMCCHIPGNRYDGLCVGCARVRLRVGMRSARRLARLARSTSPPTLRDMSNAALSLMIAAALVACGGKNDVAPITTPTITVPGAPTGVSATAGSQTATIAFTAPASNGGTTITAYAATCIGGGNTRVATGAASPLAVSGLTNGTTYSCVVTATNAQGTSVASVSVAVTPVALPTGTMTLTSPVVVNGGVMAAAYTCDGTGSTLALNWANAPVGTTEFAVLMTTLPGDGTTKWNWVLYGIPATRTSLPQDVYGVGTLGVGSDGPLAAYQAPCSQGPGLKVYTFSVYALSASPTFSVPAAQVTGQLVAAAIAPLTLGSASLNVSYARATYATATQCGYVRSSLVSSTISQAAVTCDSTFAYISSTSLASHAMMDGIVATNLQMPIGQNFFGVNAWKIPLTPVIAATPTLVNDGPIGVAVNGVPIFNPCKQGGCQNGDTKVLGELDLCNGHAGRADDYHYHAAPTCLMAGRTANYWDTHPVGWALDGFAIFGFNNADGTVAIRDAVCGGNTSTVSNAPVGYSYHVTNTSPYVLSCLRGVPSPDLAGQGAKFSPIRQPPVTPFAVSGMTLTTDAADGYQVLQFTSARTFTTTETGNDSYTNLAGTYKIRYKPVTGSALSALLVGANANKTACWNFQFVNNAGATTQPSISYCR